jgi:hypothetical protein
MRVPGHKIFVPAIVVLFAGMARSYNGSNNHASIASMP